MNNTLKRFKPLIITIGAILVVALGYIAFAYVVDMWPFKSSSNTQQSVDKPTDSRQATRKEPAPTTPKVTLKFTTNIKANEPGDCVLTMKSGKNILTEKSTTKGTDGQTGCPEWKLDTSKLPAGKYEVTVVFTGETVTEKSTMTITLPK